MVSFTGSTAAGRRVAVLAGDSVKRVALELGGKSANVILPGADLETAVKVGVANAYSNSGQTCSAWSRMLVQWDHYDEAVQMAVAFSRKYVVGDPFADDTRIGPLVSKVQRDRVVRYLNVGQEEGARLVAGGDESAHERGYYVEPAVFAGVAPGMTIEQEEIFGPVLSIVPFGTVDEAVTIANGTPTAWRAPSGRPTRSRPSAWPAGCAPARSRSTAAGSTRWRPSAATGSRGSAGSWARPGSTSSSRSSLCRCELSGLTRPGYTKSCTS